MKSRRHKAIAVAQKKMWNAHIKQVNEVLILAGFEKKQVDSLYDFQKVHLSRMLRNSRNGKGITRILGSSRRGYPVMGVDYSNGKDITSAVTGRMTSNGVQIESLVEVE